MTQTNFQFRLSSDRLASAAARVARGAGLAAFVMGAAAVLAQNPAAPAPETHFSTPEGYTAHHTVDLGGRINNVAGSGAMYDTLVNLQSGPRVMGETFEMHALPGNKHPLVDTLTAVGSGFGGDPYNFAKLDFSKGKVYDFSGIFRRDRQYFDYDLLANPNVIPGLSVPIGPSAAPTGSLAWPQAEQSPVMFNTVRRMTDTTLTLYPLSTVTYRFSYSQNIFQGPTLSPGPSSNFFDESVGASDMLLQEYQRNSTDDFTGGIDWKPLPQTKLTFEEEINHYKADSFFTIAPQAFLVQEADGTPAAPGGWDGETAYGLSSCNSSSMINPTQILYAPQTAGGKPVIDPACDVATSYLRSQPTRILFPTEIFRFQSSSIRNVSMDGDFRYMNANMSLPNYYENFEGLDGAIRSITYTGSASVERQVVAADYGIVWQATKTVSLAEQLNFSNVHQPGISNISAGATLVTPTTAGNETINYTGSLAAGKNGSVEGSPNGTPWPAYFGQKFLTNDATVSWDATPRATLSLTYRHSQHVIAENEFSAATSTVPVDPGGNPGNMPLPVGATTNGTVTINQNGGILNAALRPTANWNLNGSVEVLYADNAFTPVGARQSQHYRVHTTYRPRPWATVSGAFNDYERHNNTNNNQAAVAAGDDPYEGPLNHIDRSRVVSANALLMPNDRVSVDIDYSYTDVYAATNICYDNGATPTLPGTASTNASGAANVCPGVYARGSKTQLADWYARDFMDAPTQYGAAEVTVSPTAKVRSAIGYRITAVDGSEFFNDARAVNGSLNSTYDSPYFNVAWTVHPGLVWRADYNFYGYGEGGPSGPQYCSTSTTTTSTVVPCTSLPYPTGLTESQDGLTASRHFHANNLAMGVHYEF
ncbi:MAG: hypothetical protein ACLQHF_00225 [Terracidiphilus sp.]